MSQLFETIHIKDCIPLHLQYHQQRMNEARRQLFHCSKTIDLATVLSVPPTVGRGSWKCKIIYRTTIENIEFFPYYRRTINTLKLVVCDTIDYRYKYTDRSVFDELLKGVIEDDIIIVKNGLITDTSYSNLAFYDGTRWVTPAKPLLCGTTRIRLLETGILSTAHIRPEDLHLFSSAVLINAMNSLNDGPTVPVGQIHW